MNRLNQHGYEAYLVGGAVRDLLLKSHPKDFDIATNATPEQVQKLFRNSRLIGRRFRLAHIIFGREIIEVSTFRGQHDDGNNPTSPTSRLSQSGMLLRDNVYGSIEEDAWRRDFTINALYYSAQDFTIRDYCGGLNDLKNKVIRLIGDPQTRYREDPVRMLRTLRFAAKLSMEIEPNTLAPINSLNHLLNNIPAARLFDESLKLLQSGYGYPTYLLLRKHHLFEILFPTLGNLFTQDGSSNMEKMINIVLNNTDKRIQNHQHINPAFMFAAFLWYPLLEKTEKLSQEGGLNYYDAFTLASHEILSEQSKKLSLTKRINVTINDIWQLQLRLNRRFGQRPYTVLTHERFRAAYDLLEYRANIEQNELVALVNWWQIFQTASAETQSQMLKKLNKNSNRNTHYQRKNTKNKPRMTKPAATK